MNTDGNAAVEPGGSNQRAVFSPDAIALLLVWAAAAAVFLIGPIKVGFVSDDYDLARIAAASSVWRPLEPFHFSPLITIMFKAAAAGVLGPLGWHLFVLLAHLLNIGLLRLVLVRVFRLQRPETWCAMMIFAMSYFGFEALAWTSAAGYVFLTAWILTGLVILNFRGARKPKSTGLILALLQVVSLLTWDFGILFAPVMALVFWLGRPRNSQDFRIWKPGAALLGPAVVCCLLLWLAKKAAGYQPGYGSVPGLALNIPWLIKGPIGCLIPGVLSVLNKSRIFVFSAGILLAGFLAAALKDRRIRVMLAIFFLWQVPYLLFATAQSRYFYFAAPFLCGSFLILVSRVRPAILRHAAYVALAAAHLYASADQALLWRDSYRESQRLKGLIENAAEKSLRPIIVVNLPDQYGPEGRTWRPFMWRKGLSSFSRPIIRVNCGQTDFTWIDAPVPVLSRMEIRARYPDQDIYEASYSAPEEWRSFKLSAWPRTKGP